MKSEILKKIVNSIPDGKEVIFEYSLFFFNNIDHINTIKKERETAIEDYEPGEEYFDDTRAILDGTSHLKDDDYIISF